MKQSSKGSSGNCRMPRFFPPEEASHYIAGLTVGLDLTCRDLQLQCKEKKLQWTVPKGYDNFCALSSDAYMFEAGASAGRPAVANSYDDFDLSKLQTVMYVNGVLKQSGTADQMIHSVPRVLSHISEFMTLQEGDLIMMGTPEGVGPLVHGDVIEYKLSYDGVVLAESGKQPVVTDNRSFNRRSSL